MNLPKLINFVWPGNDPLPKKANTMLLRWQHVYPDYQVRIWRPENYLPLRNQLLYDSIVPDKDYRFLANLARFEIIHRVGGLYFDLDIYPVKRCNFDELRKPGTCLLAYEKPSEYRTFSIVSDAVIGALPGDPFIGSLIDEIRVIPPHKHNQEKLPVAYLVVGPPFVTAQVKKQPERVTIMPYEYWHPFRYDELLSPQYPQPATYGIHFFDSGTHYLTTGIPDQWFRPVEQE